MKPTNKYRIGDKVQNMYSNGAWHGSILDVKKRKDAGYLYLIQPETTRDGRPLRKVKPRWIDGHWLIPSDNIDQITENILKKLFEESHNVYFGDRDPERQKGEVRYKLITNVRIQGSRSSGWGDYFLETDDWNYLKGSCEDLDAMKIAWTVEVITDKGGKSYANILPPAPVIKRK